jgi:methionine synthase II (cobalamin-independent)
MRSAIQVGHKGGAYQRNFLENDYYPDDEAYVFAVADAMKHEYRAIVDAGFVLQLDAPDVAMGWNRYVFADKSIDRRNARGSDKPRAGGHTG